MAARGQIRLERPVYDRKNGCTNPECGAPFNRDHWHTYRNTKTGSICWMSRCPKCSGNGATTWQQTHREQHNQTKRNYWQRRKKKRLEQKLKAIR